MSEFELHLRLLLAQAQAVGRYREAALLAKAQSGNSSAKTKGKWRTYYEAVKKSEHMTQLFLERFKEFVCTT